MGAERGKLFIGFDCGADGTATVVSYDGQVYRFLGYVADDGVIFGDVPEAWYLDADGTRVDIPATLALAYASAPITAFTVPLRDADQHPALQDARPRCAKCSTLLAACDVCGGPAQCGEAFCAEHHPD